MPQTARPLAQIVAQGLLKAITQDETGNGRALAAWDDEGFGIVELSRLADLMDGVAHAFEDLAMFAKVTLESEDADGKRPMAIERKSHSEPGPERKAAIVPVNRRMGRTAEK